ncbi:prepilin peptidase [Croceicoccus mobilis]|uniref:Prepilin peptidase n=1 Tax=Croceicoccus mobilis TaxID=1703339 RepID=A0A916Z5E3_9SPHN|nr:A24 family peptidase [Croceicoccus mobilis]GGD76503.1 hypothetical protein GCM10010990_27740 [Croceicoccus mobilis]
MGRGRALSYATDDFGMPFWSPHWPVYLAFAVVGAVIGSFAGAAAIRMARGEGVALERSHCDSCGRVLGVAELVPLLSFILLRGACRECGARIDRWQPFAEIVGTGIGLVAVWAAGDLREAVLLTIFGWQLLVLGLSDARSFHLPPVAIAVLALCAAIVPISAPLGANDVLPLSLQQAMGGSLGFLMLAVPALAYRAVRKAEGMGSADPALFAAIGLWLGPLGVCITLLLAAGSGIALALAWRRLRAGNDAVADPESESVANESGKGVETGLPDGALPLGALLCPCAFLTAVAGFSTFSAV